MSVWPVPERIPMEKINDLIEVVGCTGRLSDYSVSIMHALLRVHARKTKVVPCLLCWGDYTRL